ncbi:hypothetical protein E3T28_08405 [Cryobacterium sinapicolor]|uniref:Uncharacterized protein n=1 Tax=Cryobacterium sinapicolor TaxID=1259236 RepID=A0ABY2J550_9MICO|nr:MULTISPECIES: hypothetical protein [Cryobacterium]TFC88894.1 hypothetical protein E3O67_07925 [Cryobacterium sp. TMT3-29-2]TFC99974.1 hypothetical protein E3T28_08405 [Cryobacterium sinapicolor]
MDRNSATPPPANQSGPPQDEPDEKQESTSPVGDMFEEGETDVGPHPSLINLENWEPSELASSAGTEETGAADTKTDE